MFTFLLVLQAIVAAALIAVILMQKSEGGGLGVGGSPAGFLSARGAADFLTRATALLATAFVVLCIVLAVLAAVTHRRAGGIDVDAAKAASQAPAAPATAIIPGSDAPAAGGANAAPSIGGIPLGDGPTAAPAAGATAGPAAAAPTAGATPQPQPEAAPGIPLKQ